jgi:hypothetical protein
MVLPPVDPEPIDQRVFDAASGSVFTGNPEGRWMPKWASSFSLLDIIVLAIIALAVLIISALILL